MQLVQQRPQSVRKLRKPQIAYNLAIKPWQIQPFFIHPVLPGETLRNALLMTRCVSDPLRDKLMGWHLEHFVFYVKHTDLDMGPDLVNMHLNASQNMSSFNEAANIKHFHPGGGINFVRRCLEAVRFWYFRDAEEAEPTAIDGLPPAKINHDGWWQSAKLASDLPANTHELPGDDPELPPGSPASQDPKFAQWEAMRAAGLTSATYEDYLKSFGVRVEEANNEEERRPELLRYDKKFTYPTNTVEPTTGVPSSAAVWSVSERLDKDRYFSEPGFIFGVVVVRPKVLLSAITGTATAFMNDAYAWLPAIVQDLPYTALRQFATATGPSPVATVGDYWIDLRDLFIHGEQFRNHDLTQQGNTVALPTTAMQVRYASLAMADAFFTGVASQRFFRLDGLLGLDISSSVFKDYTE